MNLVDIQRAVDFPTAVDFFNASVERFAGLENAVERTDGDVLQLARDTCEASQIAHLRASSSRRLPITGFRTYTSAAQKFARCASKLIPQMKAAEAGEELRLYVRNVEARREAIATILSKLNAREHAHKRPDSAAKLKLALHLSSSRQHWSTDRLPEPGTNKPR